MKSSICTLGMTLVMAWFLYPADAQNPICGLPPDSGFCRGRFMRFFFDPRSGECRTFLYSGCVGNPNNFLNVWACRSTCVPPPNAFPSPNQGPIAFPTPGPGPIAFPTPGPGPIAFPTPGPGPTASPTPGPVPTASQTPSPTAFPTQGPASPPIVFPTGQTGAPDTGTKGSQNQAKPQPLQAGEPGQQAPPTAEQFKQLEDFIKRAFSGVQDSLNNVVTQLHQLAERLANVERKQNDLNQSPGTPEGSVNQTNTTP